MPHSTLVPLIMDFLLAVLMLLAAILIGLFWKEIIRWLLKQKHKHD
jgi:hypothetical protein